MHGIGLEVAAEGAAASLLGCAAVIAADQILGCAGRGMGAGLSGFAAVCRIFVAIEVSGLAFAVAAGAIHVIAACGMTIAAMLCVAQQIVAGAVAQRVIFGAADDTAAGLTGFVILAFGVAVAAIIGVSEDIDAVAVTESLVGIGADAVCRFTRAIDAGFGGIADISTQTAILWIDFMVDALVVAGDGIGAAS